MKVKEGIGIKIIWGDYKGSIGCLVHFDKRDGTGVIKTVSGTHLFSEDQHFYYEPLPDHFINNPGKRIMKARLSQIYINGWYWCIYPARAGYFYSTSGYNTKQGARKALKKWAAAYGVNVEVVS